MKIESSIGWFIASQDDVEVVKELTVDLEVNVHLSFYQKKDAEDWMWRLIDRIDVSYINSIHLPKGLYQSDYTKNSLVWELANVFDVKRFVVHPWASDLSNIVDEVEKNGWTLCLENFGKKGASPFSLISQFGDELQTDHLGLCVDFSHLHPSLCTVEFVKALMPYTKMWHASNQKGKNQHLPISWQDTDTQAHRIISNLLSMPAFPIQEIVLEYFKEYKSKAIKNYFSLKSDIIQRRRKIDG